MPVSATTSNLLNNVTYLYKMASLRRFKKSASNFPSKGILFLCAASVLCTHFSFHHKKFSTVLLYEVCFTLFTFTYSSFSRHHGIIWIISASRFGVRQPNFCHRTQRVSPFCGIAVASICTHIHTLSQNDFVFVMLMTLNISSPTVWPTAQHTFLSFVLVTPAKGYDQHCQPWNNWLCYLHDDEHYYSSGEASEEFPCLLFIHQTLPIPQNTPSLKFS
jgi:hypothetical protein